MQGRKQGRVLKGLGLLVILVVAVVLWQLYEPAVFTKKHKLPAMEETDKIWVITDIHHLAEGLADDGSEFQRMKDTAGGKDLVFTAQRMEALIWQVEQERPRVLLVSGDLTFNGEKASALELAAYFQRIEELGTSVLVIPGNHDITDGWARRYVGAESEPVAQILPADFSEIFAEMGYEEAFSRDSASLSYAVQPFADVVFVMLDTNKYSQEASRVAPEISGHLPAKTKRWLRQVLQRAEAEELRVIPVMHHNLTDHNDFVNKGYTIDHAAELQALFFKHEVAVVLSGHIHAQDIRKISHKEQIMHEIVTGAFANLASNIGELTIADDVLTYERHVLAIEAWAEATGQTDPRLFEYARYGQDIFYTEASDMTDQWMYDENWYNTKTAPIIAEFIGRMNIRYFMGRRYDPSGLGERTLSHEPGYQLLQEHPNSFLTRYVEALIGDGDSDDVYLRVKLKEE